MTSGYSRMRWAVMIPSRKAPDLIAGHWHLLQAIGAAPRQLVWDNEGAVGCWRRGRPTLTAEFENFRGSLGIGVHLCRPRDPEAKGLTERNNGYFETSFLPGREFTGPEDFNTQFGDWLGQGERTALPADRLRPDRPMGAGSGRDARAAADPARCGVDATGSGFRATTTCGSHPTTTPSTPRWSAGSSTWSRT